VITATASSDSVKNRPADGRAPTRSKYSGETVSDHASAAAAVHRHLREGVLGGAVRLERVGVEVAIHTRAGLEGRQRHELAGVRHRERPQHERVEQAAHGRGRTNGQRQCDDDDQ
jgi:hypothetical protein